METLRETDAGIILPVTVVPKAAKEEIVGWHGGRLKIKVSAPPEKGQANAAVIRVLSKTLSIPQNRIILIRGASSRQKEFLLAGCNTALINKLKSFF